ncbi:LysR family transcriptional regulator [Adlercreutzia sp. ZJ138]|uniref:LysR family transcriptional regulator n=1 Tax=Adlercreutzia sp. ZJ138 TaxID=2709405 RepID=UPI0013EA9728|nr:LysR family transcriptional regulator [Adlercreutzia sp. ZJ138]
MSGFPLTLANLDYFEAVYRLKSYSYAAKAIPMSYQGLRKAIAKIEAEIGYTLFETDSQGNLICTQQANVLHEYAEKWRNDMLLLSSQLEETSYSSRQVIPLAASFGVMWFFDFFFFETLEQTSSLRLKVDEYPDNIVDRVLNESVYNLALTVAPFDKKQQTLRLGRAIPYAWINARDELAGKAVITPHDLRDRDLFLLRDSKASEEIVTTLFSHHVRPSAIRYLNEMVGIFASSVRKNSIGITVAPLGKFLERIDEAVCIPLSNNFALWEYGLSYRKGYVLTEAEKQAAAFIIESAKQFQDRDTFSIFL